MSERFKDLGYEAVMMGWIVVLGSLFIPVIAGLATAPGEIVDVWWLVAAGLVAFFGAVLIGIGHGLLLLVGFSTSLARRFLRWRHSRVWRQRSRI